MMKKLSIFIAGLLVMAFVYQSLLVDSKTAYPVRNEATYADLMASTNQTFTTAAFAPSPKNILPASHSFSGRLQITGKPIFNQTYGTIDLLPADYSVWPVFNVEFVQNNNRLIPVDRSHGFSGNSAWSITAGVGKVWDEESDNGYSRAAFPYTIKQFNSNCEHNGLATFLFKNDGDISNVQIQNVAETCISYGFEFFGSLTASYTPYIVTKTEQVINERDTEEANWLPTKPLTDLAVDFPGVDLNNYGYAIDDADLNGYSIFTNGISYQSGCNTRYGQHPYCIDKTIAAYSLTKSMYAFILVAALEKQFPGFKSQLIADLVPECNNDNRWDDVTVEHALDMATGNYKSGSFQEDEHGTEMEQGFFVPSTRKARALFSCTGWPHKAKPGSYHVYHTSDTELVSYAAYQFAKQNLNSKAKVFNDIVLPIYRAAGLSQYAQSIQRTKDTNEAWGGYGLSVTLNDVVRMAKFIRDDAITSGLLDSAMVTDVLTGAEKGLNSQLPNINYDNAFWRLNVGKITAMSACGTSTQVPFMSGIGGHTSVLLPEVIMTQLTDGGGIGFSKTITDIFTNINSVCPSN